MGKKDYDKILFRLLSILTKLSNSELPTTKELASEFGVGIRTIQNDIKRLEYSFPIERTADKKLKFVDGYSLKRTTLNSDEMMILNLALSQFDDVADIDRIKSRIFKKLLNSNFTNPYFIKQDDIEDIEIESPLIEFLEKKIQDREIVRLKFQNNEKEVEPYKIANFDGFWYLFAKDLEDGKIKTFDMEKIKDIYPSGKYYKITHKQIHMLLNRVHSSFFQDGVSFVIRVKVYSEIAQYFKRKDFLESQKIEEELEDGSLIVSFEVSHDEDVDNIIKSWLPHIEVIEPKRYREKIYKELHKYIQKIYDEN